MVIESIARGTLAQANAGAAATPGGFRRVVTLCAGSLSIAALAVAGRHNGEITGDGDLIAAIYDAIIEPSGTPGSFVQSFEGGQIHFTGG